MHKVRTIVPGKTRVSFRTTVDYEIKRVEGVVRARMSIREARERGLIRPVNPNSKNPRKSGTILEIDAELEPGHHKLIYKHRSLVRFLDDDDEEEVKSESYISEAA